MKKSKAIIVGLVTMMSLSSQMMLVHGEDRKTVKRPATVTGVQLTRFSKQTIKVSWKAVKKAKYYHVYYKTGKNAYKIGRTTDKTYGLLTKLKNNTKYDVYVTAGTDEKADPKADSFPSKVKSQKTKTYTRTIVFSGDSIVNCLKGNPITWKEMHSTARIRPVGIVSINSHTYLTQRSIGGKSGLQKTISYRPYRVYFMLGLNEVCIRSAKQILADRQVLLNKLRKQVPNVDVVWCATPPVTRAEMRRAPSMRKAPALNKALEAFAKKNHCHYLDYTAFLKDKQGFLKLKYATGDGFHWKRNACAKFGQLVGKYDKSLDD